MVICGAGISGVSAAYFLARAGVRDILIVDELPPLTLTSDRSTECYRNWWPDPAILGLMNRSIELLEALADASNNCFHLNRRGYLYVTGDESRSDALRAAAERISGLGGGPLRVHEHASAAYHRHATDGFHEEPAGADLLLGSEVVHAFFPYLSSKATAALHARKAGWMSAQQLGMYLLHQARALGVSVVSGHIDGVETQAGRISGIRLRGGERMDCSTFVDAAGPYLKSVAGLLGVSLPVHTEVHLKAAFRDPLGIVPRDAPLLIWDDPQVLPWAEDERALLNADRDTRWLTGTLPAGAHTRPEGPRESQSILMLWDYRTTAIEPVFPVPLDEQYPEIALRGLSTMLPGLGSYFGRASRPVLDGGYYVRTKENRLLVGPTSVPGAFVIGAVSGYGIMAACGAGELLAAHVLGSRLPEYAPAFSLSRYDDPLYEALIRDWAESGQL